MDTLLEKVKANLILEHSADDALLQSYITAAVSYAESYQHIQEGYYTENAMPATTEQAVIMLASHFYESRDGSTGGFFADNTNAAQQVWNTVNLLLRLDLQCDWFISAKAYQNLSLMEFLLEAFHLVGRERTKAVLRQTAHEKRPKNTAIAALHAAVEVHI